jgi:hypothetical protein
MFALFIVYCTKLHLAYSTYYKFDLHMTYDYILILVPNQAENY